MKPWMTEAIGTQNVVLPSSVCQATLAMSAEVFHARQVVQIDELARLEQLERLVERPAGDDVAGGAACSLALSAALYSVGAVGENDDVDVGVGLLEHRDDLVVPDRSVVGAPALDSQRHVGGEGRGRARSERQRGGVAGSRPLCIVIRILSC